MNIDEYRELVAQEAKQAESQAEQPASVVETPAEVVTETVEQSAPAPTDAPEPTQTETQTQTTQAPSVIEIDGKEVPIDELKGGYLRQQDYTRKTQELAREREKAKVAQQYFDVINARPDIAKQFAENFNLPYIDPEKAKVSELETKYQDLLLERDVELLSVKYPDFDSKSVLKFAYDEKIDKLENAYLLLKAKEGGGSKPQEVDVTALTEQIRQQVMQEIQSNVDTGSLIGKGGSTKPVTPNVPQLSPAELKVATAMGLTPAEYQKYK